MVLTIVSTWYLYHLLATKDDLIQASISRTYRYFISTLAVDSMDTTRAGTSTLPRLPSLISRLVYNFGSVPTSLRMLCTLLSLSLSLFLSWFIPRSLFRIHDRIPRPTTLSWGYFGPRESGEEIEACFYLASVAVCYRLDISHIFKTQRSKPLFLKSFAI